MFDFGKLLSDETKRDIADQIVKSKLSEVWNEYDLSGRFYNDWDEFLQPALQSLYYAAFIPVIRSDLYQIENDVNINYSYPDDNDFDVLTDLNAQFFSWIRNYYLLHNKKFLSLDITVCEWLYLLECSVNGLKQLVNDYEINAPNFIGVRVGIKYINAFIRNSSSLTIGIANSKTQIVLEPQSWLEYMEQGSNE